MYRFALRPWWIVSHLVVLALVVAMVSLGFWQLRRLDEADARNTRLAQRLAQPEAPLAEVVPDGATGAAVDRRVVARGSYRPDEQVLVRGRSLDDAPGSWVVVPFETDAGQVVAVNRGWIRNDGRHTSVPEEYRAVPEGQVEVHGLLLASQVRGPLGATDPTGRLDSLARLDLDRLDAQVAGDLLPVWLQLTTPEAGAPDPSPTVLDLPVVDDRGPHLSYAAQWFIFSTIAAGGYPLILRKVAGERGGRHPDDAPGLDDPDPDDAPAPGDPRLGTPASP
ncbi:MAG TPA: SURF1 family protein [Acidimicrobiales bacterium]|nr:SURF1 family protein [Acidimicrobiales bacterium]